MEAVQNLGSWVNVAAITCRDEEADNPVAMADIMKIDLLGRDNECGAERKMN
jgi:hypothetical protein